MNSMLKNLFLWVLIAIVFMYIFDVLTAQHPNVNQYTYSEFLQAVENGDVKDVVIHQSGTGFKIREKTVNFFAGFQIEEEDAAIHEAYPKH